MAKLQDVREVKEKFILHWGEMGTKWGINRTMAQVQALLYISQEPLSADEIMHELQISRGNVSMSLRELINWGIVNKMHVRGERKEYFTTEKDVWELFKIVLRERKKREIDPTIEVLHELLEALDKLSSDKTAYLELQLQSLLEFIEAGTDLYDYTSNLNPINLMKLSRQTIQLAQKVRNDN